MIQKLRQLRLEKGLTQKELAEQVGVTQKQISKYETDYIEPNIEMLIKLSKFFDVTIDYLVGSEECHYFPAVARSPGNTIGRHLVVMSDEEYQTLKKLIEKHEKNRGENK